MDRQELYQRIHLQAEVIDQMERIYQQDGLEQWEDELEQLQDGKTAAMAYRSLLAKLKEDDDHWRMLCCQMESARRVFDKYQNMRIPETIYIETMKCFPRFLKECQRKHGRMFFDRGWWTYRQTGMSLFRIGTLEYEFANQEGVRTIAVHIPSDADLSEKAVDDSRKQADIFFQTYFKDYSYDCYSCDSWLLSPALKPLLSGQSRILAFQNRFEILWENMEDQEYMEWLFQVPSHTDPGHLPQATSLQRKVKALMQKGGTIGSAYGIMRMYPKAAGTGGKHENTTGRP